MSISRGGRNLILLGLGAITIAIITVTISLSIYHNSGDIYIDSSRPGYESDKKLPETDKTDYTFPDSGTITSENIDQFLTEFEEVTTSIQSLPEPFSEKALSDETLDILAE